MNFVRDSTILKENLCLKFPHFGDKTNNYFEIIVLVAPNIPVFIQTVLLNSESRQELGP